MSLLLAAIAADAVAGGAVLTWPGAPPCNTTLHACIAAAVAGDTVEIATDGPIDETIEIFGKSLTLRAAEGFEPVFEPTNGTDAIEAFGADAQVTILIDGLTVRGGTIGAYQAGTGAFDIAIRGNRIESTGLDANRSAIYLRTFGASPTGPVQFEVTDNDIALGFLSGDDICAIALDDLPGPSSGSIARNRVRDGGEMSTYPAMRIHNATGTLALDVVANAITASGYNGGIELVQDDVAGSVATRILNNLVVGGSDVMGPQPGAVSLRATAGGVLALVANNTLAHNDTGFIAKASPGATLEGALANNIVAFNAIRGIVIDSGIAAAFDNAHNLAWSNAGDAFEPGPGTLASDPLFVGAGDYHLRPATPARDTGDDQYVPEDIEQDLDGSARIIGPAVDIGAFERPDSLFADGFEAP
ncbi:MAG: hypothetical protein EOP90_01265 [Lysobacteraceae bacterium]|nr:MAG: hypothetical protein EOP90_01265 [Xanthomonadaceae bacterium]